MSTHVMEYWDQLQPQHTHVMKCVTGKHQQKDTITSQQVHVQETKYYINYTRNDGPSVVWSCDRQTKVHTLAVNRLDQC